MTCYWDGILSRLTSDDYCYANFVVNSNPHNTRIHSLIGELKNRNVPTICKWNGVDISKQLSEENVIHIRDYDANTIYNGYDCSVCDPFLILICNIFALEIHHTYLGHEIIYAPNKPIRRVIHFTSNRGHFY